MTGHSQVQLVGHSQDQLFLTQINFNFSNLQNLLTKLIYKNNFWNLPMETLAVSSLVLYLSGRVLSKKLYIKDDMGMAVSHGKI